MDKNNFNEFEEENTPSLEHRVVKSGFWMVGSRFIQQVSYLVRTVVLARLLSPNDFGLFGIALLMLHMLDTFTQTGFRQALIQKKENIRTYLDSAWTIELIKSLIIAAILFFAAPYISIFFRSQNTADILKVISLCLVVRGMTNIAVVYFEKEFKFHKYFAYNTVWSIVDLVVAVSVALFYRNVWALVFGRLAGEIARCAMSYIIDSYRPKISFNFEKTKELFIFGKWMFGVSILSFLFLQGDDFFVGRIIGASSLGIYQMAYLLSNLPATEITQIFHQITFPAYSKLQDNVPKLRHNFFRTIKLVTLVTMPVSIFMIIMAYDLINVLLGEKWLAMVYIFQLLCIIGAIRSITANFVAIFLGVKRPDIQAKISIINVIILGISIYPLIMKFGLAGAVYARFLTLVSLFYAWPNVLKILQTSFSKIIKAIIYPVIGSVVMAGVVLIAKNLFTVVTFPVLFFLLIVAALSYAMSLLFVDWIFNIGIKEEVKMFLKSAKKNDNINKDLF